MKNYDLPRLVDYLDHISESIERCQRYVESMDEADFLKDEKTQDAVIRTFEVMGEASNNIKKHYPDFIQQRPEVPFNFAYEMRNVLTHGYFQVDLKIIWKTIHTDLEAFHKAVTALHENIAHKKLVSQDKE